MKRVTPRILLALVLVLALGACGTDAFPTPSSSWDTASWDASTWQ